MSFLNSVKTHANQIISNGSRIDCYLSLEHIVKNSFLNNKPSFQRMRDEDKVKEIIKVQQDHITRNNQIRFPQSLIFGVIQGEPQGYLLDGQHRFLAICELYQTYRTPFLIPVCIHQFQSYDEMKTLFFELNQHTSMPEYVMNESNDKTQIESTCEHFFHAYPNIFVSSSFKRVNRPKIRKDRFQEAVHILVKLCEQHSQKMNLIHAIETQNQNMALRDWTTLLKTKTQNQDSKNRIIARAKKEKFWLGLSEPDSMFEYQWVSECFYAYTGINTVPTKTSRSVRAKRTSIPKAIKRTVWDTYIGSIHGEALCPCCNHATIHKDDFHAGHVVAQCKGGTNDVDNLRPICGMCNLSMGDKDMREFVKTNFPTSHMFSINTDNQSHISNMSEDNDNYSTNVVYI